jgi:simple sugar transport system permease protein
MHATLRSSALVAGTVVAAVALLALLLAVSGYDAGAALGALWRGAFGSWTAIASGTLLRATPLLFTGLAVSLAFTTGILNVGAEGQLLVGATAATAVGLAWPAGGVLTLVLALLAGTVAGGAWAAIPATLRARFGVLEVISTIMLNFVALNLTGWLVRGPLQEPTRVFPQSDTIAAAVRLPRLVPGTRLHAGVALAVVLALALAWALRATAGGFRVRMTGANAAAAASAGRIRTGRVAFLAFLASGALAGLGGAVEVLGVTFALYENLSPGYGYTAIAVALLAGLRPGATIVAALLFGALQAGAAAMQRDAGVPAVMVSVVEACIIVLLLASERVRDLVAARATSTRGGAPTPPASGAPGALGGPGGSGAPRDPRAPNGPGGSNESNGPTAPHAAPATHPSPA